MTKLRAVRGAAPSRPALGAAILALILAACAPPPSLAPRAAAPSRASPDPAPDPAPPPARALPVPLESAPHHEEPGVVGVVHVVRSGETVYRIARAYGVDAADLMETNGISDPRAVAAGTALFIAGASRVVSLSPPDAGAAPAPLAGGPAPLPGPAPADPRAEPPAAASLPTRAPPPAASAAPTPTGLRASDDGAPLAWPLKGVLYGRYGVRAGQRHDGIDIAAPEGAPVAAAADGVVIFAGEQPGYGAIVILKHADDLVTLYAHNSRVLVKDGQRVSRGDPIARVGQTGRTTGPHLHFEVRKATRPRNPLLFLP
ncbi:MULTISPECIES: M23 family metallopeptidase [unclassified Anaeromyxobacter]|uniref:peptidoglycan DD-metalloendopeptidase family protein n=1 Tax=unclassified Anaeromyxobacter TaxID=2620896 RepID=UPI001F58D5C3|nr:MULTISPECIES: M23 family metallopeptidase [unclassified Anaeromyxobacter]